MKLTFMTDKDITLRDTDPDKNCYKISNLNFNFSFFKKKRKYPQETKALCPPASSTSRGWGRTVVPAGTEPWSPPHRPPRRPRKRRAGSRRYCPTPFPGAARNRKLRKRQKNPDYFTNKINIKQSFP